MASYILGLTPENRNNSLSCAGVTLASLASSAMCTHSAARHVSNLPRDWIFSFDSRYSSSDLDSTRARAAAASAKRSTSRRKLSNMNFIDLFDV